MAQNLRIFVVEDNLSDVLLIQEALNAQQLHAHLHTAVEGERAIHELTAMGPADLPNLIILDLNLPRVNGLELLRRIRSMPKFGETPVLVLTSSRSPDDRVRAEQLGASAYLAKPMGLDEFLEVVGGTILRLITDRAAGACGSLTRRESAERPLRANRSNRRRRWQDRSAHSVRAAARA